MAEFDQGSTPPPHRIGKKDECFPSLLINKMRDVSADFQPLRSLDLRLSKRTISGIWSRQYLKRLGDRMKKILVVVAAAMLVAGCASSGNEKVRSETMDTMSTKVTKGVTTKDQVKAIYGEPSSVSLTDGGSEVWKYAYAHATAKAVNFVPIVGLFAGGADVNKNEVVFIFDKNDTMQNYTVHASQSETHRGGGDVGE